MVQCGSQRDATAVITALNHQMLPEFGAATQALRANFARPRDTAPVPQVVMPMRPGLQVVPAVVEPEVLHVPIVVPPRVSQEVLQPPTADIGPPRQPPYPPAIDPGWEGPLWWTGSYLVDAPGMMVTLVVGAEPIPTAPWRRPRDAQVHSSSSDQAHNYHVCVFE